MDENCIECGVYYKANNTKVWLDVTPYISPDTLPKFNPKIEQQFFEFKLKLDIPKDGSGNYIYINDCDDLLITENRQKLRVMGDICLGRPVQREVIVHEWGDTPSDTAMSFDMTCRQRNFSYGEFTLSTKVNTYLSDILDLTFADDNLVIGSLGGIMSNGTIIPKYVLDPALNIQIAPIEFSGEAVEVLNNVLEIPTYRYWIKSYCEPDTINLVNTYNSVIISDKMGTPEVSADWKNGINRSTIDNGVIINPYYDSVETPSECKFMPTESEFKYNSDSTNLKNYIKFLAYVLSNESTLDRFEKQQHDDQETFSVGKALDILYVARSVNTFVGTVADTNNFEIDTDSASLIQYDSDRLTNNALGTALVGRIVSNSVEYFREFTILGTTITLTSGVPESPSIDGSIATLAEGDVFELVNGYDVLEEGLESYPDDGDGYIIKHIKPTEDCYFQFFQYDRPNECDTIVCYYYKIEDYQRNIKYWESIKKYSQGLDRVNIPYACSKTEIDLITNQLLSRKEPLETLTFTSYRKNVLLPNSRIKADLLPIVQNNMIVVENFCEFINPHSPYSDKALFKQEIKLASYVDNLDYEISKIKMRSEVKEAKVNAKTYENINFDLFLSFNMQTTISEIYIPDLPANPRFFYKFVSNGDANDYSGNDYHGSIPCAAEYAEIINNNLEIKTHADPNPGRMEIPLGTLDGLGDFSIHFKAKITTHNIVDYDVNSLCGFDDSAIGEFDLVYFHPRVGVPALPNGVIMGYIKSDSYGFKPDGCFGTLDTYYQFTLTRNGTTGETKGYMNGVLLDVEYACSTGGNINAPSALNIGQSGLEPTVNARSWQGKFRGILGYARILTEQEISDINAYFNYYLV